MANELSASPPQAFIAWQHAVASLGETAALVDDLVSRFAQLEQEGAEGLSGVRALLNLVDGQNRNWLSNLLPRVAGDLPGSLCRLVDASHTGVRSLPDLVDLQEELATRRDCALKAEHELSAFVQCLRGAKGELDEECRRLKRAQRNEAAQIGILREQANDVLRQAREHARQIKEEQSHWYSPIAGYWKVLFNVGGVITGARMTDGLFDLRDSVQEFLGSIGITDGIPDSLAERIEAIECDRRKLLARQHALDRFEKGLADIELLGDRLARNLSDLSKISSFWSVLESKLQSAINSIRRSSEAVIAVVRDLHLSSAAEAMSQLGAYARQMDLRSQFQR